MGSLNFFQSLSNIRFVFDHCLDLSDFDILPTACCNNSLSPFPREIHRETVSANCHEACLDRGHIVHDLSSFFWP